MALSLSTDDLIHSLEQHTDVVSWINDTLDTLEDVDTNLTPTSLTELDERITQLLATLDIACEDTSSQLERAIDDVSRGVPRLIYDLHFMSDGAESLQGSLAKILQKSKEVVPDTTSVTLDHLRQLDLIKRRMEDTREALKEAESWSTLELEVTSLITERSYAKAAERLSEADRGMMVFHNTPEYESRRHLMVNLQNQLEAALSSALIAAITSQDIGMCQNYFSIFCRIQREPEFRNYYNASRRAPLVAQWQNAALTDCGTYMATPPTTTPESLIDFMQKFYKSFLALLNSELVSLPAIFPDPAHTLSALITSILSSLQPTVSQRLASLSAHYGPAALPQLIALLRTTENFAVGVTRIFEKISYVSSPSLADASSLDLSGPTHSRARRRSTRMSISWRTGTQPPSTTLNGSAKLSLLDGMDWDQELFQPFLDFQSDYASLEKRMLDHALHQIVPSESGDRISGDDRARLFRERAVDIIAIAEESLTRCTAFTYGYGSVALVLTIDHFIQSFIEVWTLSVKHGAHTSSSHSQGSVYTSELSDMDYSGQDWSGFQALLHLLSSARTVFERISSFEVKLRSSLAQTATRFRLGRNDPVGFTITPSKGESQLLEQSSLNTTDLHELLIRIEADTQFRDPLTPASRHSQLLITPDASGSILVEARRAIFNFANSCQSALQEIILSPLRKNLTSYPSLPLWGAPGDPKAKRTVIGNDLEVPKFSLSPSDTIQRVAEGLLNLPRLFEVYADDDALAFSLHTLPYVDTELLQESTSFDSLTQTTHKRRSSLSTTKLLPLDPDAVSSTWLSSLGHVFLDHVTIVVLPNIPYLSAAGAAQLVSDLEYLSNIVQAINVEFSALDKWKEYVQLDDEEGRKRLAEVEDDPTLSIVAKLRRWAA